jgi:hypothetical protein|mmetsp:Transcript_8456/g.1161  ORF Transcript_8456/g.1161 Transcript_8456/m.1161 type:complete len:160 (+) Transcript_8456:2726-3205(+)
MTGVQGGPVFVSKPYFYQADPVLGQLVNYTTPQYDVPSNYDTVTDVEPYSGATFYIDEKLMFLTEMRPDTIFNKLSLQSLSKFGYITYQPIFYLDKIEEFTEHTANKYYGSIKDVLLINKIAAIVGYLLGSVLIVALIMYWIYLYVQKRRRNNQESLIE